MRFHINPSSAEPIYAQIVRQVRRSVATGVLETGDRLPPVRQLAASLVINPNTIAAAYRQMEREGLVHTMRGRGTFVAGISAQAGRRERRRLLQPHLNALLTEATHLGFDTAELLELIRKSARNYRLGVGRK
jgi:GntR family transcriptional regulator